MTAPSQKKTPTPIPGAKTIRAGLLAAAMFGLGCADPPPAQSAPAVRDSLFAAEPERQWRLPRQLAEISGLAASADGRVFAHDDETAVIYEIDVQSGRLVSNFALGDPIETGDFEGLAIAPDGVFYMITSRGRLYRFVEGGDGEQVEFERIDTGMRAVCEVEGLAYFAPDESLIIACKRMHDSAMRDRIWLYAWRPGAASAEPWLSLSGTELAARAGVRRFRPSGVEVDAQGGHILLLSAIDGALAVLTPQGEIAAVRALGRAHRQAEGVTVAADGALIISDEAAGGQALLSRYARIP